MIKLSPYRIINPNFFFVLSVNDLFNVQDNKSISLEEVLEGLRYVMDYRIKDGSQPHLDKSLMKRLSEGLFLNMGHTEGHLLKKKTTAAADMAFFLFGNFLEEGKILNIYQ